MAENPQITPFFTKPEVAEAIEKARDKVRALETQSPFDQGRNEIVVSVLTHILAAPKEWDQNCQFNIVGHETRPFALLTDWEVENEQCMYYAFSCCLRCLYEFSLYTPSVLDGIQKSTLSGADISEFVAEHVAHDIRGELRYAVHFMPMAVLRFMLAKGEFGDVRQFHEDAALYGKQIEKFKSVLAATTSEAKALKSHLDDISVGYNFVGLYEGFKGLAKQKEGELRWGLGWLCALGSLAIAPLLGKAIYLWQTPNFVIDWRSGAITATGLALTGIFLYFFKVALANYRAAKAQLVQIDLRRALCRFIQRYAEYAKDIQSDAQGRHILDKFENVVFSGIVAQDEKLPATFDGMEQFAKLLEAVRGGNNKP